METLFIYRDQPRSRYETATGLLAPQPRQLRTCSYSISTTHRHCHLYEMGVVESALPRLGRLTCIPFPHLFLFPNHPRESPAIWRIVPALKGAHVSQQRQPGSKTALGGRSAWVNPIHVVMMHVMEKGRSTVCMLMAMAFYRRHGKEELSVTPHTDVSTNSLSEYRASQVWRLVIHPRSPPSSDLPLLGSSRHAPEINKP